MHPDSSMARFLLTAWAETGFYQPKPAELLRTKSVNPSLLTPLVDQVSLLPVALVIFTGRKMRTHTPQWSCVAYLVSHHSSQSNYFLNQLRAPPGTSTGLTATIDEKYMVMGPGETFLDWSLYPLLCTPYGVQRRSTEDRSMQRGNTTAKVTATQQLQNPDIELPSGATLTLESRKSLLCIDPDADQKI